MSVHESDPLRATWQQTATPDDWDVPCVYESAFLGLVAGELNRLADELAVTQQAMREEDNRTLRSSGLGEGIRYLRDRAENLRVES